MTGEIKGDISYQSGAEGTQTNPSLENGAPLRKLNSQSNNSTVKYRLSSSFSKS
jgi:hypothetical protein